MSLNASATLTEALIAEIRGHYARGVTVGREVLRFIESTYGDIDAGEAASLLRDDADAEAETLRELLFFPDEALHLTVESRLKGAGLDEAAVGNVIRRLAEPPIPGRFRFPPHEATVKIELPARGAETIVARLHLDFSTHETLEAVLGSRYASPDQEKSLLSARLRLRNAALAQTPFQVGFLERFFRLYPTDRPDWTEMLDFILAWLSEIPQVHDAYIALMERKRFHFRQLIQARRSRQQLEKSNMEILVMTGIRVGSMDTREAITAMERIDRLALFLFGRTEHLDPAATAVDLGAFSDAEDFEAISRLLSD